jgi:hypothetical protein
MVGHDMVDYHEQDVVVGCEPEQVGANDGSRIQIKEDPAPVPDHLTSLRYSIFISGSCYFGNRKARPPRLAYHL